MDKKIVIGLVADADAGKTTLTESLLFKSGTIRNQGRVDHRDAFLDTFRMEKERGITIFSKTAVMDLENTHVTIVDTPGHGDFSSEMERTLWVLDYAALLISQSDGITGQCRLLWNLLRTYGVPTIIFVNKTDRPDFDKENSFKEAIGEVVTQSNLWSLGTIVWPAAIEQNEPILTRCLLFRCSYP